jgi:two-component system, OmpR family, sensor histidine kinase KdpD
MNRTSWSIEELRTLLSTVSHDLRTPLSVITGRASVLRETVREEHRRDLDTIIHEAQRLSRTLENLLACTEAYRETTPREWVPVEELVGGVLARLESSLEGRPVNIDVPDDLLAHVHPVRGELLLANLLDHVATHTPAGVPIDLTVKRNGHAIAIDVASHSAELRADKAQQLVTPQHPMRADALALAACQTIVSSYGGTIEASEGNGGGTVFHISLPDGEALPDLAEPASSEPASSEPASAEPASAEPASAEPASAEPASKEAE